MNCMDEDLLSYFFEFEIDEFICYGIGFSKKGNEVDLVEVHINNILNDNVEVSEDIESDKLQNLIDEVSNRLGDIPINDWIDVQNPV